MNSEHWIEEINKKIIEKNTKEITLATGKTPSGHIHVGILREIIICDSLKKSLEKKNKKVRVLLFLDDLDAAKRFPSYIDNKFQKDHLGKPFAYIPCPFKDCGCESYGYHFGNELISAFDEFDIKNEIIWAHDLYKMKEMQEKLRISLEKNEDIKEILRNYILPTLDDEKRELFLEMQKKWMPVMVICEKCNRIQNREDDGSIKPNRVLTFNNSDDTITYTCPACGHSNSLSIDSGRLKMNWRVDWPAKWAIFKTSCEPAGKDHCVRGGSYDTGLDICQNIFGYEGPVKVAYEWVRLGDRDMKTSKGIVFTPEKFLNLADPEIFRTLILRTNPMKHISLRIEEIPQYHDYFEKMENIYYEIEESESSDEKEFLKYLYPLTKVKPMTKEKPKRIPIKLLSFLSQIQNILSIEKLYDKAKSILKYPDFDNNFDINEFKQLLKRTKNWIDEVKKIIDGTQDQKQKRNLTQKITIFTILEIVDQEIINKLDENQVAGIKLVRKLFIENDDIGEEEIQNTIFSIAKETLKIPPKKLFEALYQIILGKKFGPRLGSFLTLLDKEWLIERLNI